MLASVARRLPEGSLQTGSEGRFGQRGRPPRNSAIRAPREPPTVPPGPATLSNPKQEIDSMADALPLRGMAALVTGGSGAIGSASARWLLRDGCSITLMARRADVLER